MDYDTLRKKLKSAKLIIGDIRESMKNFFSDYNPAPIAAIMHDLDFYSSTKAAMSLFEIEDEYLLPRIFNYFDDIIGNNVVLYNNYTGERLAIYEFNNSHEKIKISSAFWLLARKNIEEWYHQIFITHLFGHRDYNKFIRDSMQPSIG
jgi:hypothetical protein